MNKWLFSAGIITAIISLLHVAIVIGGADWYIFFGAGTEMARQSDAGMLEPVITTLGIALSLALVTFYTFTVAFKKKKLPFSKQIIFGFTYVMIFRGLVGIPIVYLLDHPYLNELSELPLFMVVSSIFCLGLGIIYWIGMIKMSGLRPSQ